MKKLILFLLIFGLLVLPQNLNAQEGTDCRKTFDKEMYKCLTDFNACQEICFKEAEKPDGTTYFNSGELYPKCMKANQCHEKSDACREQALADFRACGKPDQEQEQKPEQITTGLKLPVFLGEWYELVSATLKVTAISLVAEGEELNRKRMEELEIIKKEAKLGKEEIREQLTKTNQWRKEYEALKNAKFWASTGEGIVYKAPGSSEFKLLGEREIMVNGGVIQTTSRKVAFVRTPTALIKLEPIGVHDPGVVEFQNDTVILKSGIMTVVEEKGPDGYFTELKTPKVQVKLTGTQVVVTYDEKKEDSFVLVYEGEVEVKTKEGKVLKVKPNGDKPGVVVVSQKLSPIKLVVAGAVLIVIIGGVILILKRKVK